jgi:1-aminocyclopropane-1-carboxylate deaminase/D-cysteine desulfhydrase-like pyridoxal-dependent ACC family enzyme
VNLGPEPALPLNISLDGPPPAALPWLANAALQPHGIPWLSLGQWPTPVAHLRQLSQRCGASIFVKRDDLSGESYGGNKIRKLEFLLAAALQTHRRSILTVGGVGSNHVVATAIYARAVGLQTHAVVFPQPLCPKTQQTMAMMRALSVKLVPCPGRPLVPFYLLPALLRAERPYFIGPGGSSPLGTLGYVYAALELKHQIEQGLLPEPDDLYVTLGSGGTAAGLLLGLSLAGLKCRVMAVRVVERPLSNAFWVRRLVRKTRRYLHRHGALDPSLACRRAQPLASLVVVHDYFGGRYGRPTEEGHRAAQLALELEGLTLDLTYTAKTMAALLAHAQKESRGRSLLFWNTYNSRDPICQQGSLDTVGSDP